jgi:hypothetical protein
MTGPSEHARANIRAEGWAARKTIQRLKVYTSLAKKFRPLRALSPRGKGIAKVGEVLVVEAVQQVIHGEAGGKLPVGETQFEVYQPVAGVGTSFRSLLTRDCWVAATVPNSANAHRCV